jgi:kinesin family protein C2/C3
MEGQLDPNLVQAGVKQHAVVLGMDPVADAKYLWIAEKSLVAPLTDGWQHATDEGGNAYYYNEVSGESSWEHPADQSFIELFHQTKAQDQQQEQQYGQQHYEQQQQQYSGYDAGYGSGYDSARSPATALTQRTGFDSPGVTAHLHNQMSGMELQLRQEKMEAANVKGESQTLYKLLTEAQAKITQLQSAVTVHEQQNAAAQHELTRTKDTALQTAKTLQQQLLQAQQQAETQRSTLSQLQSEQAHSSSSKDRLLTEQLESQQRNFKRLEAERDMLQHSLKSVKGELASEIDASIELKQQFQSLQTEAEMFERQRQRLVVEKQSAENNTSQKARLEVDELQAENQRLTASVIRLEGDLQGTKDIQGSLEQSRSESRSRGEEVSRLQKELEEEKHARKAGEAQAVETAKQAANSEEVELMRQQAAEKSAVADEAAAKAAAEVAGLKETVATQQQELEAVKAEKASAEAGKRDVQAEVERVGARQAEEVGRWKAERERLEEEVQRQKQRLEDALAAQGEQGASQSQAMARLEAEASARASQADALMQSERERRDREHAEEVGRLQRQLGEAREATKVAKDGQDEARVEARRKEDQQDSEMRQQGGRLAQLEAQDSVRREELERLQGSLRETEQSLSTERQAKVVAEAKLTATSSQLEQQRQMLVQVQQQGHESSASEATLRMKVTHAEQQVTLVQQQLDMERERSRAEIDGKDREIAGVMASSKAAADAAAMTGGAKAEEAQRAAAEVSKLRTELSEAQHQLREEQQAQQQAQQQGSAAEQQVSQLQAQHQSLMQRMEQQLLAVKSQLTEQQELQLQQQQKARELQEKTRAEKRQFEEQLTSLKRDAREKDSQNREQELEERAAEAEAARVVEEERLRRLEGENAKGQAKSREEIGRLRARVSELEAELETSQKAAGESMNEQLDRMKASHTAALLKEQAEADKTKEKLRADEEEKRREARTGHDQELTRQQQAAKAVEDSLRQTAETQRKVILEKEAESEAQAMRFESAVAEEKRKAAAQAREEAQVEVTRLSGLYHEESRLRRELHNRVMELQGNIRVFCRCRPINEKELKQGPQAASFPGEATGSKDQVCLSSGAAGAGDGDTKKFEFERVFNPQSSQEEVFERISPFVTSALDGFNVCIFAYGQTGSGKTFTMDGPQTDKGVNQRAVDQLFTIRDERSSAQMSFVIKMSMLEVYNEQVCDLLDTSPPEKEGGMLGVSGRNALDVRQGPNGTYVPGLVAVEVISSEDVQEIIGMGMKNRSVASHSANAHSSRSHLVITVTVEATDLKKKKTTRGVLNLIDLAGSERLSKTDAKGQTLTEAKHINKSLSALGDVIGALGKKGPNAHVPFRNSKLTHLLQNSLSGNSKVIMFVNISPALYNLSETVCSLKFAARCRKTALGEAKANSSKK